jgi:hypothetical protein
VLGGTVTVGREFQLVRGEMASPRRTARNSTVSERGKWKPSGTHFSVTAYVIGPKQVRDGITSAAVQSQTGNISHSTFKSSREWRFVNVFRSILIPSRSGQIHMSSTCQKTESRERNRSTQLVAQCDSYAQFTFGPNWSPVLFSPPHFCHKLASGLWKCNGPMGSSSRRLWSFVALSAFTSLAIPPLGYRVWFSSRAASSVAQFNPPDVRDMFHFLWSGMRSVWLEPMRFDLIWPGLIPFTVVWFDIHSCDSIQ